MWIAFSIRLLWQIFFPYLNAFLFFFFLSMKADKRWGDEDAVDREESIFYAINYGQTSETEKLSFADTL